MASRPRIVIVNFNGERFVQRAVTSALNQSIHCEVVVVDNASSDRSVEVLRSIDGATIVESTSNLGFGAGANLGASLSTDNSPGFISFLNPDAQADPLWQESIIAAMSARGADFASCSVAGGAQAAFFAGGDWHRYLGAALTRPRFRTEETAWISGCAMTARAESFRELKGFDPAFFLYFEDVDLSFRATSAGKRLLVTRDAHVTHEHDGLSTNALGAVRKLCIAYGSKGLLVRRHLHGAAQLPALAFQSALIMATLRVSWSERKAILSAFLRGESHTLK